MNTTIWIQQATKSLALRLPEKSKKEGYKDILIFTITFYL